MGQGNLLKEEYLINKRRDFARWIGQSKNSFYREIFILALTA
jgi:hypothetical protein